VPENGGSVTREDVNRLSDKIDGLHTVFVTRNEHTSMHSALMALISTLTAQVTQLASTVERNKEASDRTKEEGGKWILEQLDLIEQRLTNKLDEQAKERKGSHQWVFGLLYGTVSSLIVGILVILATHAWR
jgi:hypothetical protein